MKEIAILALVQIQVQIQTDNHANLFFRHGLSIYIYSILEAVRIFEALLTIIVQVTFKGTKYY